MSNCHLRWSKSSYSVNAQNCFELASTGDRVVIRNSNRVDDGVLELARPELGAFVAGCKAGEFDDLVA
jgi:hypothetical protein